MLVADIDYIMLGMPGTSLSDSALNTAGLPSVKEMLMSSKKAARLFKPDPHAPQAGDFLWKTKILRLNSKLALASHLKTCTGSFSNRVHFTLFLHRRPNWEKEGQEESRNCSPLWLQTITVKCIDSSGV